MTSKERAALRGQANTLEALFQVGKGGISDTLIQQTEDALKARELIKLKVLTETSPMSARESAEELARATSSEVVQVIGGVMVLYRYNPKLHEKKKVVKKPVKKTAPEKDKSRFTLKKKSPFEDKKGRDKRIKRADGR